LSPKHYLEIVLHGKKLDFLKRLFFVLNMSDYADCKDKNQNTRKKNVKTCHFPSLLKFVAMTKDAINKNNPSMKMGMSKLLDISCPITRTANNSFPTSYNALANSFRWVLSNSIHFNFNKISEFVNTKKCKCGNEG